MLQNIQKRSVSTVALLWGLVVFFPVGMNYLSLFLLLLAVSLHGDYAERWQRIRQHPIFRPVLFFLGWTLLVLAAQDRYHEETLGNLWHGVRIGLTLLLAVSLSHEESKAAVKGLAAAFSIVILWLLTYHLGALPTNDIFHHLTAATGNKSIAASLLFAMLAVTSVVVLLKLPFSRPQWIAALTLLAAMLVIVSLGRRSAMLGLVLGLLAISVHLWRDSKRKLLASSLVLAALVAVIYTSVPQVEQRIEDGIAEVSSALQGKVTLESWNIRLQMILHSFDMMMEKPLLGWGIGSWNEQWQLRVPDKFDSFNMPHNDLLWMGAQGGIPGALAWLLIFLSAAWAGWQIRTPAGRAVFAMAAIVLFGSLVNSGTRDATMGLPLLWVLGVAMAYARADALNQISPRQRSAQS